MTRLFFINCNGYNPQRASFTFGKLIVNNWSKTIIFNWWFTTRVQIPRVVTTFDLGKQSSSKETLESYNDFNWPAYVT